MWKNKSLRQTLAGAQPRTCHPRNRGAEGRVPARGDRAAADRRLFFSRSGLPPTRGSGAAVGAAVTRAARGPAPRAREEAGPRPGSPLAAADVAARSPALPLPARLPLPPLEPGAGAARSPGAQEGEAGARRPQEWRGLQGRREVGRGMGAAGCFKSSYLIKTWRGEGKREWGEEGRDVEWKCEPPEARGVGGWMRGPCPRPPTRACSPGADDVLLPPRWGSARDSASCWQNSAAQRALGGGGSSVGFQG